MANIRLRRTVAGIIAAYASMHYGVGEAATLPVPCVAGSCGSTNKFVGAGQASASQAGSKLTVDQTSQNVTLNWQSFNISADGTVQFVQPSSTSVALNRIFSGNPSQIFGALDANGRVYLINGNGIIFGSGAQVNVGSLVASTLDTSIDSNVNYNYSLLAPAKFQQPAFQQAVDANGTPLTGAITIQKGATLQTPEQGQILIFAPQITNQGTISTPGGQTVLAAGTQVYLAAVSDATMRGLLVEVSADSASDSTVTNGTAANASVSDPQQLVGQILADRGNITLAGLAVNQLGRVSATTSINVNGSIRLQAYQGSLAVDPTFGEVTDRVGAGGKLTLGVNSDTEVTLDTADPSTTVDSVAQPKSDIALYGATIDVLNGSTVRATSGTIEAYAAENLAAVAGTGVAGLSATPDASRIYIAPQADLDVSGASVTLPVSSNVIPVQLRSTELADSPLQQNGPLHGATVDVDVRAHGTLPDGSSWQGTPLADVSGEIAAIQRNVAERNLTGGTITLESQGDVIVSPGALLNVSGGATHYTGGMIDTSWLLGTNGVPVPIGSADPNQFYIGVVQNGVTVSDPKWGTSQSYPGIAGQYEAGYVQGADAGTVNLSAPRFVLDGSINGSVEVGPYQRLPTQASVNGGFIGYDGLPQLYRNYDQVPLGATLVIGGQGNDPTNFVTGSVVVQPGEVLPGLKNADGSAFNPLADPLPASYIASVLRPELIGPDGFNQLSVSVNGQFLLPASSALSFEAGGALKVRASNVDLEGSIDAPGGTISAAATFTDAASPAGILLELGPHAQLTARGEWVNDNPALYPGGANSAPLYTAGGAVTLTSQASAGSPSELILDPGSLIDVSGGAQLTAAGALLAGKGGTINLAALPQSNLTPGQPFLPAHVELGATLQGFGLTEGGALTISAGAVCIAAADCSQGDPNTLWLSPASFSSGGFASYAVNAEQGALSVEPGTFLRLEQSNLQLAAGFPNLANAPTLPALPQPVTLPDLERQPVSLSLTQQVLPNGVALSGPTLTVDPSTPSLVIGQGVLIEADPGATLSADSDVRILIDGTLTAPGGNINLALTEPPGSTTPYSPSQGIWLGPQAVLDAHGVPLIEVLNTGLRSGEVLAGGNVSISAEQGYLELLQGSVIDVSGATGVIDVAQPGLPVIHGEQIASSGGSVTLSAAEGLVVGTEFKAAAGVAGSAAAQPEGGSLTVELTGGQSGAFPQLVVSQTLAPVIVQPGSPVPAALAGEALLGADSIKQGGFDSLTLRVFPQQGAIDFVGNVGLTVAGQLTLDAPSYRVSPGGDAQLQAPYVEFGNSSVFGNNPPDPTPGTGTLEVSGGFIELYGSSSLQGIASASFDSSGDLRLRGLQPTQPPTGTISGALYSAGDIELTASQIYPATLSQFAIAAGVTSVAAANAEIAGNAQNPGNDQFPASGTITVRGTPGTNQDLLSAGGSLTLLAANIEQQGVLRAPFGTIDLQASSIDLGPGSVTSTSANGLTIPFGTTQGGFDWVYPLQSGLSTVYGTDGVAPPSQHVILNGANVAVETGAVVDVSGGGDLQAYEWIPGVGGTKDVLSQVTRPNQYAIIPDLNANVAPYDPNISLGSTLQPGDAVYLSGAPGLPAGTYLLLPARYALLPGAFLVTATPGYQDMQPGQIYTASGGGWVVSGYQTLAGTPFGDSRTSGFTVVPASIVLQQAQYTTTSANQFFASQVASANAATPGATPIPTPSLPEDSGVLALIAQASLSLDGSLRTTPGTGGRGAEVDISSSQILVAPELSTPHAAGQLLLTSSSLDALGVGTLLLGGLRNEAAISTDAQSVTVANGATLSAPEVLLAATDQLTVADGASVVATGTAPATALYSLTGNGAFLRASAGPQAIIERTGATSSTGDLTLAAGSSVSANGGSIYLGASSTVVTDGAISAKNGDLALQSSGISIGTPAGGVTPTGTVLAPGLLSSGGLHSVLLSSASPIDFLGNAALVAQNLTLDSPGLSGSPGDVDSVSVSGLLTLSNSAGAPAGAATPPAGSGALTLSAADIALGPGAFTISGFPSVTLSAQNALTATANGALSAAQNLTVSASRITTASGVAASLSAGGALSLEAPAHAATLAPVTALGGSLSLTGSSISVDTGIALPSGEVALTATGAAGSADIVLGAGGSINVAGTVRQFDGVGVATPGGVVTLTAGTAAVPGNVTLLPGSRIDVSPGSGGAGGSLSIAAPAGTFALGGSVIGGGSGEQGSSFSLDTQSFESGLDFSALNTALNTGGFTGSRNVRLRGVSGGGARNDLSVAAGDIVTAHTVTLEADQGSIGMQGLIDASGASGGSVTLAAGGSILVGGTIDAHATGADQRGGDVELDLASGSSGSLQLAAGSLINVAGGPAGQSGAQPGAGGTVLLRVPSATVISAADGAGGVLLDGSIQGERRAALEAVLTYTNVPAAGSTAQAVGTDGTVSATDMSYIQGNVAAFMGRTDVTGYAASLASTTGVVLEPGVEIDEVASVSQSNPSGSLALNTPWNLFAWRYGPNGDVPGVLTLRAQGGVTFNASLSDGFASSTSFTLPTTPSSSWSYRIVAGADQTAANPLAVDAANPADVMLAACTVSCVPQTSNGRLLPYAPILVRTGDGFIDVSASGNFTLGSQASLLYTAGVFDGPAPPGPIHGGLGSGAQYPTDGGDIRLSVGGDVDGALTNQFVNSWLWRMGSNATQAGGPPVAWTVNFLNFQQGIGALGGGEVTVSAGGNINDLSVSIPTIGFEPPGATAGNAVQVMNGGNLSVQAGGSILGGGYFVGQGSAVLRAGVDIGAGVNPDGSAGVAPVIGLGNASASLTAADNLTVAAIVNPTLLSAGTAQRAGNGMFFDTYGADSEVTLTAIGGDVSLPDDDQAVTALFGPSSPGGVLGTLENPSLPLDILPPTLNAYAFSGNIGVGRNMLLTPSPSGTLQLFAGQNISVGSAESPAQIVVSDADATLLPGVTNPESFLTQFADILDIQTNLADQHAVVPVHLTGAANPVRVVAAAGDVSFLGVQSGESTLWSAEPVQVAAGLDVLNLDLVAQNLRPSDVTSVSAGRDITYPTVRSQPAGTIEANTDQITIDGPGQLELTAGRTVDLGTSDGVVTRGNLVNTNLPAGGASVSITAGVAGNPAQIAGFVAQYIDGSSDFDSELVSFVEGTTGATALSAQQAKQIFEGMNPQLQTVFVEQVFFELLRTYGREAAAAGPTHDNYSGAFAALETLFPGANPNLAAGGTNPYSGDIDLYFSQVNTEQGGNISLLAPGGAINAGLAQLPTTFGVAKGAGQLGLVAQTNGNINAMAYSDFLVNQSRVMTGDGGNILVWSTEGNIDAGRGSKTALSAAPATVSVDPQSGAPIVTFFAPRTGSGIQTLASTAGVAPGDVDLFAPHGVVNANDAGIVAGNLTIAATAVLGTSNITVSGTSVGVPVAVTGLGAGVAGASSTAGGATAAQASVSEGQQGPSKTPAAEAALGWLDVFVLGFGEETCKPDDAECLKRQSPHK